MLLAFTNASCIRTGVTNCRESPEARDGSGVQGALSGTTVISGFRDGTLSGVALAPAAATINVTVGTAITATVTDSTSTTLAITEL